MARQLLLLTGRKKLCITRTTLTTAEEKYTELVQGLLTDFAVTSYRESGPEWVMDTHRSQQYGSGSRVL